MTVQVPSANTLLDQTFFATVANDINALNDKVSKTSSQIYDTAKNAQVTSFTGSFSISTNQIDISNHILDTTKTSFSPVGKVSFGTTFIASPIVVASIQSLGNGTSGTGSSSTTLLSNVSIQNVTTSGADIYVALEKASTAATISYKVNVVAIGLVQA